MGKIAERWLWLLPLISGGAGRLVGSSVCLAGENEDSDPLISMGC